MTTHRRRPILITALVAYCTGLGLLGGILVERLRFDERRGRVLADYAQATRLWREHLMTFERSAQAIPRSAALPRGVDGAPD